MAKFAKVVVVPASSAAPVEAPEVFPIAAAFAAAEDVTTEVTPAPVAPVAAPVGVATKIKRVISNSDKARREFDATVKSLGEAQAKGVLSLVALALEVAKAASGNLIGEDDAQPIIESFQAAKAKKLGNEAADAVSSSITQQASKLRQIIKLGLTSKLLMDNVTGEQLSGNDAEHYAEKLMERARDRHVGAMASDETRKSLKDKTTYGTLVNIARAQLGDECKGIALTDEQIDGVVFSHVEKQDKSGIDFIKSALKSAIQARDGKEAKDLPSGGFSDGRDPVENDNLNYAIDALDCALRELDPKYDAEQAAKEKAKAAKEMLIETAAAFGLKIVTDRKAKKAA